MKQVADEPAAASSLMCEAIRRRSLLGFQYHGLERVVQPYCHGFSTRGTEVLRAIQIGGASHSRGFGFGKLWAVAEMRHVRVLEERFAPADPQYNPQDSGMSRIHCHI